MGFFRFKIWACPQHPLMVIQPGQNSEKPTVSVKSGDCKGTNSKGSKAIPFPSLTVHSLKSLRPNCRENLKT